MRNPHRDIHRRMMSPTNAVVDTGIDLRRRPANVVLFRPNNLTRPIPEIDWMKSLAGEFWLPWPVPLPEAPRVKGYDRTVPEIMRACASAFGVSVRDLKSVQRHEPLVTYRQAAVAIVCQLTSKTLTEIGKHFCRDHSTIHHAKRMMATHVALVGTQLSETATPFEWGQAMRRRLDG